MDTINIHRGWDLYLLASLPFIFLVIIPGIEHHDVPRIWAGILIHICFLTQVLIRSIKIGPTHIAVDYPFSFIRKNRGVLYEDIRSMRVSIGTLPLSQSTAFVYARGRRPIVIRIPLSMDATSFIEHFRAMGITVKDER